MKVLVTCQYFEESLLNMVHIRQDVKEWLKIDSLTTQKVTFNSYKLNEGLSLYKYKCK